MSSASVVWIIITAIGFTAGIFSGLFGIGGGIIIIPSLIFFMKFSQTQASGTSLIALLLPVGAWGSYEYYKSGKIGMLEIKYGLIIGLGIFVGAYLGAKLGLYLPESLLKKFFAVFLFAVSIRMWLTAG